MSAAASTAAAVESAPSTAGSPAASTKASSAASSAHSASDRSDKVLCEGLARIPFTGAEGVFYNKVQVFNRDLSIAVIAAYVKRRQLEHGQRRQKRQRTAVAVPTEQAELSSTTEQVDEGSKDDGVDTTAATEQKEINEAAADTAEARWSDSAAPESSPSSASSSPSQPSPAPSADFPGIRILEALSATGLRSIRYYLEVPSVAHVTVNDCSPRAVQAIRTNIAFNQLPPDRLTATQRDAKALMYEELSRDLTAPRYDVIDLDPYGSAADFLDASVQAVNDGGLLAITCTDKAVLCGAWGEVAYAKYGGYALKGKSCHEMAIRLVLGALQSSAARYRRYIIPLLSLSIDFYVRVFVRVRESQLTVKHTASRMAIVYQCSGCEATYTQRMGKATPAAGRDGDGSNNNFRHTASTGPPCPPLCPDCQSRFRLGGPMWADALHDAAFVAETLDYAQSQSSLSTIDRLRAVLSVAMKELPVPLYVSLSALCHVLHCQTPKLLVIRAALINAGYGCSDTHALPDGIKTDAPPTVVWDIMRSYLKHNAKAMGKLSPDSPAAVILSKEPELLADFTYVDGCDLSAKSTGVPKFLPNPEHYWGPKQRANSSKRQRSGHDAGDDDGVPAVQKKARRLQGRNRRKRPCDKLVQTGACRFGESCKFSHDLSTAGHSQQSATQPHATDEHE